MFRGKVIKSESIDPNYKIKFSYHSDEFIIHDGEAVFTRKSPLPKIIFDGHTDNILKQHYAYEDALKKIELELGKTVIDHIISGTNDMDNLWLSKNYAHDSSIFDLVETRKKMFINNSSKRGNDNK